MDERAVAYCLSRAREFRPISPDALLCPECGGPPEATSANTGRTILDVLTPYPEAGQTTFKAPPTSPGPIPTQVESSAARSFSESDLPTDWKPGDGEVSEKEITLALTRCSEPVQTEDDFQ